MSLNRKEVIIGNPAIGIIKVSGKDFFSSIYGQFPIYMDEKLDFVGNYRTVSKK